MTLVGGNLDQMRVLEQAFTRDAQAVSELQARISNTLAGTAWTGPAADRFRQEWNGSFVPALNRLRDALTENAAVVRSRTEAIRTATS